MGDRVGEAYEEDGDLVLAIDAGSSSLRTNLFTMGARRLAPLQAQLAYEVRMTPDGGVDFDPYDLLECLCRALDDTLGRAGERAALIRAVGMCSQVPSVLGIDSEGKPTTPIYSWADTRSSLEAEDLRRRLDQDEYRDRTGCPIYSYYMPARLTWLKRAEPGAYARTARWIALSDWLHLQLFGTIAESISAASWTGLLNRHTLGWDRELLAEIGLPRDAERLPPLVDLDTPLSGLRSDYAARWPSLRDVPWYPCVGDGATGNLGSGCLAPDEVVVQVGTSGAVRALVPGIPPTIPRGLWCYRLDRRTALVGGVLGEGGNVFQWLRETAGIDDLSSLEKEAAAMRPDSHGLTFLPFLVGERSPGWNTGLRGTYTGLSLSTGRVDLVRAAQEAIAYRAGMILDLLEGVLPPVRRIVACGGTLLNVEGWMQMFADVLGRPVTASGEAEASSKGAAMVALRSLGAVEDFGQIPASYGDVHQPDPARHDIYRRAMRRQQGLYEALARWDSGTRVE